MAEIGVVIQIQKNLIQLEIPRSKACGGCRSCVPMNGKDSMTTYALNLCHAKVGDTVEIEPGESHALSSSLLLYGIPLLVFIGLIVLFSQITTELYTVLFSILGVALAYFLLHLISKRMDHSSYTHKAIRIVGESGSSK
jgi:positive regulator of sigma E activity